MTRFERVLIHTSLVLVGGTGLVYAFMSYFMHPIDEFSIIHHPLQPKVQHAHIWFAPLLVFAVGLIWRQHVWRHYKSGTPKRRRSGLTLLALVAPMILSGYLIQTAVGGLWREIWVWTHVASSVIFLLAYGLHQVLRTTPRNT